ncbi:lipopolysaccharide biosynthesis protein [Candidatus Halobonum tyrrellensis]|uniref:Polysaccharide biosynthesis protein n=1 Tax=Candidatus Halobonum tyrrellensis G22 TaxID=1324957 RepID=V4GQQ0_9EURY|nr:lipopolysaccharide biosynthesis protein [Candidatus Halobonum tyrrellensis]ESP87361.1 polysaccharide biosynthesis protein [Candidatus Halobonum tyrrellensis G22]
MSPGKRLLAAVRRALSAGEDITDRSVTGGLWLGLYNVADRLLQLGTVLFLARLLAPTAFGILGLALVTRSALRRLTKLGLDTALIQRREDDVDAYLDTVWTVELVRGLLIAAVLFLAAPLVASFFGEPLVAEILRVFALLPLVEGVTNPGVVYFVKDLDFRRDVAYNFSGRVAFVLVGVGYGYATRSVWALVFATLASQVVSTAASYAIHPYRPRPRFDREAAAELFDYGKWVFGSEALMFLINEGDDAFVGWALGSYALGVYQLAYRVSNAPTTEITHPIQRVAFPAYSKVQGNVESLREGYFTTVRLITLVSFPAAVGIGVVAPLFVPVVLGSGWGAAVVPMQLLAAYAALRSFRSATVPLFRAVNRPDLDTKVRLLKLALLVPFIYPAAQRFGLPGVAAVVLGHAGIAAPVASYAAVRSVDGEFRAFARLLSFPLFGSAVMGGVVLLVRDRIVGVPAIAELILLVITGAVVYAAVMLGLERRLGIGLDEMYTAVQNSVR